MTFSKWREIAAKTLLDRKRKLKVRALLGLEPTTLGSVPSLVEHSAEMESSLEMPRPVSAPTPSSTERLSAGTAPAHQFWNLGLWILVETLSNSEVQISDLTMCSIDQRCGSCVRLSQKHTSIYPVRIGHV